MYDALIIGAGPAGLSASIACRECGLNVLVIDEFPKPGGRLLGQLHIEPDGNWWNGIEETRKLLDRANELQTEIDCGISALNIEKTDDHYIVYTSKGVYEAKSLLIATGAAETPVMIPGWTLPGVMSIGAAQVMTNVHRVRVGNRGIIIGVNVLSVSIARELQLAGIELECMALPAMNLVTEKHGDPYTKMEELSRFAHLAPSAMIRMGSKFLKSVWAKELAVKFYPNGGVKMWGMPIHLRKAVTQINGRDQVESVTICDISPEGEIIPESEKILEVDFVCIAGGLYPLAELAAVIGCPFQYIEELGGHVPIHNEHMETPLEGLYVAGNITGIESGKVARAQGTLAGLSIAKRLVQGEEELIKKIKRAEIDCKNTREKATIQFNPRIEFGRKKIEEAFNNIISQ